jgi:hypothetical protein
MLKVYSGIMVDFYVVVNLPPSGNLDRRLIIYRDNPEQIG